MIETIFLFVLCGEIGRIVRQNGRSPVGFQCLLVVMWFSGEGIGLLLGVRMPILTDRFSGIAALGPVAIRLNVYLFALAWAIIASVVAFRVARATSPLLLPALLWADMEGSALSVEDADPDFRPAPTTASAGVLSARSWANPVQDPPLPHTI